jgi:hypothetical protein
MPSTWPVTRWPPSGLARVSARSRLTRLPRSSAPSVVRPRLSRDTSAANTRSSSRMTVRQQPLTAMLSPIAALDRSNSPPSMDRRTSPPRGLQRADGADGFDDAGEHGLQKSPRPRRRRQAGSAVILRSSPTGRTSVKRHCTRSAMRVRPGRANMPARRAPEQHRGQVDHEPVGQPCGDEGAGQRRPGLHQHLVAFAPGQHAPAAPAGPARPFVARQALDVRTRQRAGAAAAGARARRAHQRPAGRAGSGPAAKSAGRRPAPPASGWRPRVSVSGRRRSSRGSSASTVPMPVTIGAALAAQALHVLARRRAGDPAALPGRPSQCARPGWRPA